MSYNQIYTIATQGLNIEKLRIDVVANNIANQHSLQKADGSLFRPSQVITHAKAFTEFLEETESTGIESIELVPQHLSPTKVYQPGHPAADKQGYLTYPGISTIDEMTTLLKASHAYEANIKVINTAHSLYIQALSIGDER